MMVITLRLKYRAYLLGNYLGIILNDVDDTNGHIETDTISTFGREDYSEPGKIISSSKRIEDIIYSQGRSEGRALPGY